MIWFQGQVEIIPFWKELQSTLDLIVFKVGFVVYDLMLQNSKWCEHENFGLLEF